MALLEAIKTAPRVGLIQALERAAAAGSTSTVETILNALSERFYPPGRVCVEDAKRALHRAVYSHQWATAAYVADFLAEVCPRTNPKQKQAVERALLACLTPPVQQKITFYSADPELPPDEYGGADRPSEFFSLAAPDQSAAGLVGAADPVVPPGEISVELSAPAAFAGAYRVSTDGSRLDLARALATMVSELYTAGTRSPRQDLSELSLVDVSLDKDRDVYAVGISW